MARAGAVLIVVLLAVACVAHAGEASKYLIADPSAEQRVDYLVITGDKFAGGLDALAAHRAKQGYAVGIVRMSALEAKFKTVRAFLAHALTKWKKPAPKYLLLVGDVDAVPTVVKPGKLKGWQSDRDLATDFDYARPLGKVQMHVGRFPCDTPKELATMIRKTIDYETKLPGGAWQRKLNFVASVGGFSKEIDAMLEAIGMAVAGSSVPEAYDMQAAYGSPNSPYCPFPPKFNSHVIDMFNGGSLLYLFVGHGATRRVADIRWKGLRYRIFDERDAAALNCKNGRPILVAVACSTGRHDAADCLGETYLKAENGPVAFIGGSRVTQPYSNGLFAKAFVDNFFGQTRTLGAVLTRAKWTILADRFSMFRLQVDAVGAVMQGKKFLEPMRDDVVQHYNLLGDPALVIRRASIDIKLTVGGTKVHVEAPGRDKIGLTLECHRLTFLHPMPEIKADDPEFEKKITERYKNAHDKVIRRWSVALKGGRATVEFKRPEKPGHYVFKASRGGSAGAAGFDIAPPKAQ